MTIKPRSEERQQQTNLLFSPWGDVPGQLAGCDRATEGNKKSNHFYKIKLSEMIAFLFSMITCQKIECIKL